MANPNVQGITQQQLEPEVESPQRTTVGEALLAAAKMGNLQELETLTNGAGINVDPRNKNGWTPLMLAARYGHVDCVQFLLSVCADINVLNRYQKSAAYFACRLGHADVLRTLLAHEPVTTTLAHNTSLGDTALIAASTHGHFDCVKLALEHLSPRRQLELLLTPPSPCYNDHIPTRHRAGPRASVVQLAFDHGHHDIAKYLIETERNLTRQGLHAVLTHSPCSMGSTSTCSPRVTEIAGARMEVAGEIIDEDGDCLMGGEAFEAGATMEMHDEDDADEKFAEQEEQQVAQVACPSCSPSSSPLHHFTHYSSFPTDLTGLVLDFVIPPSLLKRRPSCEDPDIERSLLHAHGQGQAGSAAPPSPIATNNNNTTNTATPNNSNNNHHNVNTAAAAAVAADANSNSQAGSRRSSVSSENDNGHGEKQRKDSFSVFWPVPEDLCVRIDHGPRAGTADASTQTEDGEMAMVYFPAVAHVRRATHPGLALGDTADNPIVIS